MIKRITAIFRRDIISSTRDAMALYIMIMPLIMAVLITVFAPGLNDTTVNLAMLSTDDSEHIEFMEKYAKVEVFDDMDEVIRRIEKRDNIAAIVPLDDEYEIILQGNEGEMVEGYAALLNALYEMGSSEEETTAQMMSFGRTVPPLKTKLVNMLISLTIMLAGMLIGLGIVEEKTENTISAINVSPVSHTAFVIGKSILGSSVAMASIILSLLITGYTDVNWFMIILVGFSSLLLSFIIGFVQGLNSEDVIEALAGIKTVMIPIAGSIAGYELLSDKWQWTMYWSPFYWAYKANDHILSKTADWSLVLMCTGLVLALTFAVYLLSLPKIRKGLS